MVKKSILITGNVLFLLLASHITYSQGCSDAGICSTGGLSITGFSYEMLPPEQHGLNRMEVDNPVMIIETDSGIDSVAPAGVDSVHVDEKGTDASGTVPVSATPSADFSYFIKYPKYTFQFTTYYGVGDRGTSIVTPQLEANVDLAKHKLFGQVKLPYSFISGNLGKVQGMGDITIAFSYLALVRKNYHLTVTAGTKIPANNANISREMLPLPMIYQTSLGTNDLLAGAKFTYKKWEAAAGYQHAFNTNGNEYLANAATNDPEQNLYFKSNKLKRADDAIFRLQRNFSYKRATAAGGLLFIYHLQNDVIINAAGQREEAEGSQGLTLNLNIAGTIPVYKNLGFTFIYGSPVVTRKVRPAGLGRHYVIIAGLKCNIY